MEKKEVSRFLEKVYTKTNINKERILTETADCACYAYDASFGHHVPDVVIQPTSTEEVASVMKIANELIVPVYPRGQGTSLSGGPLPVRGGAVLDFSQWDNRLVINEDDMTAVVSPGVLTAAIDAEAKNYGMMYPPDPSSMNVSTIGGNLAENAGGPRGLKYGVTKDYVLGLQIVTPKGEVIRTGGSTVKNVTGYDLTKLIVGSEGTLGIITEATLKLVPRPKSQQTVLALFEDIVDSGKTVSEILKQGIVPSKMELMDQASIAAVEAYEPSGLPIDVDALLLIEIDGHPRAIEEEMRDVEAFCKQNGAREVRVAKSTEEAASFWKARKLVSPAIVRVKPTKISEDATVPRSKIPGMFAKLKEIKEQFNVDLVVFGHAGDGNLHPNIIADVRDQEEMARVEQAVAAIFEAAVKLGGTLSGEHGIGTMKAPFMEMEVGANGLELMKKIKESWDPNNVLNPGKIFPEPNQKLVLSNG